MCVDIKNFYLGTPLDRFEYMKIPLSLFPPHTVEQYDLKKQAKDGFVYVEIRKAIYGLPQAGILANKLLKKRLKPHGYFEVPHTPGLWKHISRPVQFTLVVDDFGIKYVGRQHIDHLLRAIKTHYKVSEDWEGKLYCGITLDWNYSEKYVDISMPGYIKRALQRFKHTAPKKRQDQPFPCAPRKYGAAAQEPRPTDDSPSAGEAGIKRIQQLVGTILYYARSVDSTALMALSEMGSEQATATTKTMADAIHFLDYLASHPDATIRYHASDMILNNHSDASYLSASRGRSRAGGHFFLGWNPEKTQPIRLNGQILSLCEILKFVSSSAAEAELGALFLNTKQARILRLTLDELGHPQPPTPINCDNETAVGICNGTVKRQRSRSMEMRYFWVSDQVDNGIVDVRWAPGAENMGDYLTKHFLAPHHRRVRPLYAHTPQSPRELPRAMRPSDLRGCVGKYPGAYTRGRVLPNMGTSQVRYWVPRVA
jgi:hypothetical protein